MTKADRQVYEAIQRRQDERRASSTHIVGYADVPVYRQAFDDVDHCLELIAALKKDVERLEKVRR